MKKLTMKKAVSVMIGAAFLAFMAGCGSKNTSTEVQTYNGITKTVTTITENGKVTTEVEYTDESGKKLDEAAGEAAFESAKAEVEEDDESMDETTEAADEETVEGEETIDATLTLVNNTSTDITEIYIVPAEDDNWGDNLLKNGAVLEVDAEGSIAMTYTTDVELQLAFVNSDGEEAEYDPFVIGELEDPENVTIALGEDGDAYTLDIY